MTRELAGWLDGRPFTILKDDNGTETGYLDIETNHVTEPTPSAFLATDWDKVEPQDEPDEPTVINSLAGVDFASGPAGELATGAGLTTEHFEELEPSGSTGFTKGDVEDIIAALN